MCITKNFQKHGNLKSNPAFLHDTTWSLHWSIGFSNRKIHCIRCFLSFFNLLLFYSSFVRFRSLDVWLLLCYLMILILSYMALMLMHSLHLEMHRWKLPITYINIWGVQAFSFAQQVTSPHVTSITSGFCKIPSVLYRTISLILCFIGVQMYILTPTIKLALSDVVFLQDKSWRLRGCYCCCPTQKEKFCISSWLCNVTGIYIFLFLTPMKHQTISF